MSDDVKWPIVGTGSRLDCSCGERQHIVADLEKSRALVQQLDRTNERLYAALKEYTRWPIGPTSPTDAALILNAMRPMRERALAALDLPRIRQDEFDGVPNDALRAAAEQAREALESLRDEHGSVGENEEGEEYVTCERCDGSGWGGDKDGIEHRGDCPFKALAALDAVLKEK